jgi:phospholipase D1/2
VCLAVHGMLASGTEISSGSRLVRPGENCWRASRAAHAALLIDSADFYRAVHRALTQARHSVFILGWEIDSGTRLLRGEEELRSPYPSVAAELLASLAHERPELNIYLLRWDATFVFASERELATELSWTAQTPENVHVCMDNTVPFGGGHHQKIILIDDELVFSGGMDIARQRWDERGHRIVEPERNDANGPYGPYHDTHSVMDGPIVEHFSELVRWRWRRAAGYDAVPRRASTRKPSERAASWPQGFTPHLSDIDCAIARTLPLTLDTEPVREIRQLYLDLIAQAEDLIYIENQFLTCPEIAQSLNRRLKTVPRLRALLVSSYNPQGFLEREGMWAGRLAFKEEVERGVDPSRLRLVFPSIQDERTCNFYYKRIHSKILVVDDRFLLVSSSNITRRSLYLDTECDVLFSASKAAHSEAIARLRNDLIAEHSGRTLEQVALSLRQARGLDRLLLPSACGGYRLREIDDQVFVRPTPSPVALRIIDPDEPLIATVPPPTNPQRHTLAGAALSLLLIMGLVIWMASGEFTPEKVRGFLEASRNSSFALPAVCLLYIIGSFVLFPVTLLSLTTAAVFGPILGPVYGLIGALLSTAIMFWLGQWAGLKGLRKLLGDRIRRIDARFRQSGIAGVVMIRVLPIAPFGIVNLAAGISSIRFVDFILGSLIGFLPGFLAKGIVGDSLVQAFLHPSLGNAAYLALGISLWISLIAVSHFLARRWQGRHESPDV